LRKRCKELRYALEVFAPVIDKDSRKTAIADLKDLQDVLGRFASRSNRAAYHLWLPLPDPWRSETFAAEARRRGVAVTPAQTFMVGRSAEISDAILALIAGWIFAYMLRQHREVARMPS